MSNQIVILSKTVNGDKIIRSAYPERFMSKAKEAFDLLSSEASDNETSWSLETVELFKPVKKERKPKVEKTTGRKSVKE